MKKRILLIKLLAALMMFSSVQLAHAESKSNVLPTEPIKFSDTEGHWASETIEFLASKELISGYPDGTFRPEHTMTIAEFSQILAGVMKVEADISDYAPAAGHWAQNSINALIEENVIVPDEYYHFHPDQKITRLEIAKMIARALAARNYLYDQLALAYYFIDRDNLPIELPFTDESKLYYTDRQLTAVAVFAGIVNGLPDGSFNPSGLATRAEASVMLKRFMDVRHTNPGQDKILEQFEVKESTQLFLKRRFEVAKMIDHLVKDIIRPDDSELAKLVMITKYITEYAEHNRDPMPEGWLIYKDEPDTAYGALVERSAIAEGYAHATKVMLDALGFESMIVEMKGAPRYYHTFAWNLVKLSDGNWYHLHNSLNDNGDGNFILSMFLTTDEYMWDKGFRWDTSMYPASGKEAVLPDLLDTSIRNVNYADGKLYMLKVDPDTRDRGLYSRDLAMNGSNTFLTECPNGGCTTFVSDGEYLYMNNTVNQVNGIYRMRTDGSDMTLLQKSFNVKNMRLTDDRRLTFTYYHSSEKGQIADEIVLD